jgi:signal recognition particle receptor subunit beta
VVVVSYSGKEINAKLVYYGAGLSGKTTNLEAIYEAVPETSRGKMVSMKTQSDRTLFFDLLPLELGEILGFKTRFLLYTVPGQVFYNATRKLVLKGADAIVFVADSEVGKMEENKESLANLRANLAEYKVSLDELPWVIQYNKRDLPNVYSLEELNAELNPGGKVPFYEAVATQGKGVFETFRGVSHLLMEKVTRDLRRASPGGPRGRGVNIEETTPGGLSPAPPAAATAAPLPVGQAMAREARQSAPEPAGVDVVDYGREIELPAAASRSAGPAAVPAEPVPRVQAPAPPPSPALVGAPTPPPAAAAPAPRVEPSDGPMGAAPAPAVEATVPAAPPAPEHVRVKEVTARRKPAEAEPAAAAEPAVVPIRLQAGQSVREIVIRIVVTQES